MQNVLQNTDPTCGTSAYGLSFFFPFLNFIYIYVFTVFYLDEHGQVAFFLYAAVTTVSGTGRCGSRSCA